MSKALICIPARYGATRLPGKPLLEIGGKSMLQRLVEIGRVAASMSPIPTDLVVAADDQRVVDHCRELDVASVMTSLSCRTGTDRSREVLQMLGGDYDIIASVQVDVPLTPPHVVVAMIKALHAAPASSMATPVVQLTWDELDTLRNNKLKSPFSGCTVIVNREGKAVWFSKNIIPAIRDEDKFRAGGPISPVIQHVGIYCFRRDLLLHYGELQSGYYEQLEQLEQLRVLENGMTIEAVRVDYKGWVRMSGVDAPSDLERAREIVRTRGEVLDYFSESYTANT